MRRVFGIFFVALALVACDEADSKPKAAAETEDHAGHDHVATETAAPLSEAALKLLQPEAAPADVQPYTWTERTLGSESAPVTMVEYASLGCGHCAHFHKKNLPIIKKKYVDTGRVRFVFRDFPLNAVAFQAAQLSRCVPEVTYFAAVGMLFEKQNDWHKAEGSEEALRQILSVAGLDKAAVDACLASAPLKEKLLEVRLRAANELGVQSTPTLFINGVKVEGDTSAEALTARIDALLPAQP